MLHLQGYENKQPSPHPSRVSSSCRKENDLHPSGQNPPWSLPALSWKPFALATKIDLNIYRLRNPTVPAVEEDTAAGGDIVVEVAPDTGCAAGRYSFVVLEQSQSLISHNTCSERCLSLPPKYPPPGPPL